MTEFNGGITYGFCRLMSVSAANIVWEMVPKTKEKH
jgi:hypothetical protein